MAFCVFDLSPGEINCFATDFGAPANRPPRYRGDPAIKRGRSKEQVPVLTAVDSSGNVFGARIHSLADIRPTLRDRIEPGSIICSDGIRGYVGLAIDTASEHRGIWTPMRKSKAKKLRADGLGRRGDSL